MDFNENILGGARTAFIDGEFKSFDNFRPKLLVNNSGNKVLNSIKDELHNCDEFIISVAFITLGGLTPLLEDFKELESEGVKGKILTSDYLNFTDPKALRKLDEFSNIEIKIYPQKNDGFHTKAYMFRKRGLYRGIIGSSNLTLNALTINKEWNIRFSSLDDGEILQDVLNEFNNLWLESEDLSNIIDEYENIYNSSQNFINIKNTYETIKEINSEDLVPNSMQLTFLDNIRELIKNNEDKALLISATGTGKTYASAFAVKDFKPKKFLFLVHREQIAKQAIKSFKNVFKGDENKFGLLSGNSKDIYKDYLFSTIQSMSNDSSEINYLNFDKDEFDYIVIDEVHKAGAPSYLKILNYFNPKFWLGMTASPDRTDGFNIYELFNYNIAMDIRLQDALDQDLLCPFHYFGISDLEVDGKILDDNSDFVHLISNDRVNYLLEKSEYYGYSGDRIKALVFVSRKDEAKQLAKEFTRRGHPSMSLTGDDSQSVREEAIDRLTNDDRKDNLEYLFTVDIFNEGVDIPEVNQVLLVRPTESSIIFIQQLGRGLRKFNNKEYVVILDFIGNYTKNYLIPIALSGDNTFDKDIIRKYLMEGNRIIPGASSISFDEVSKKRIYESINNTNFSRISIFKEKYQNLKFKLGKIPYLLDFYKAGDLDPSLILNHNSFDCYHNFLLKVDKEYDDYLSDEMIKSLRFITDVLSNGKRPHEILILNLLIYNKYFTINELERCLKKYNISNDLESIKHSFSIFNLNFFGKVDKNKYSDIKFFELNDNILKDIYDLDILKFSSLKEYKFNISKEFNQFLSSEVYRKHLIDLLEYSLIKYEDNYSNHNSNNLSLYSKYSRKDVCRLLNWPKDESGTIFGYRVKYGTCPIFVTYDKDEDISESTKYQDEFISKEIFSWMTRSRLTLESKEVKSIINDDLDIHLFIKKSDDEGKEFYYLGQLSVLDYEQTTINNDNGEELPIVNFKFRMHNPIKDVLYKYLSDDIN